MTGRHPWREIVHDYTNNVWRDHGFSSWEEYAAAMYPPPELTPAERSERVEWLRGEGLTFRAISPVVGLSASAAYRQLKAKAAPKAPLRRALPLVMRKPTLDVSRATRRLAAIMSDKRFRYNREAIAHEFGPTLRMAHDELSAFIAAMDKQ